MTTPKRSGRRAKKQPQPQEQQYQEWQEARRQFVTRCTSCQEIVEPDWSNCAHCGFRLVVHCPFCKEALPPAGATFCPYCGKPLPKT